MTHSAPSSTNLLYVWWTFISTQLTQDYRWVTSHQSEFVMFLLLALAVVWAFSLAGSPRRGSFVLSSPPALLALGAYAVAISSSASGIITSVASIGAIWAATWLMLVAVTKPVRRIGYSRTSVAFNQITWASRTVWPQSN